MVEALLRCDPDWTVVRLSRVVADNPRYPGPRDYRTGTLRLVSRPVLTHAVVAGISTIIRGGRDDSRPPARWSGWKSRSIPRQQGSSLPNASVLATAFPVMVKSP